MTDHPLPKPEDGRRSDWRSFLRPAKRAMLAAIQKSPIRSTVFGPPKRTEPSTKKWIDAFARKQEASYVGVMPETTVFRKPPQTLEPVLHWKFTRQLRQTHRPCFVTAIKNGRVWGPNGAVITPDDGLLRDVSRESDSQDRTHSAFSRFRLGPLRRVQKRVAVLATVWSGVYFHWMLDVLPRLELLDRGGFLKSIDAFVVSGNSLPFQQQALQKLGIGVDRLIVSDPQTSFHLEAEELIVPSLPSALDSPMGWACEFVRRRLGPGGCPGGTGPRRLYLSRSRARGRRILNEDRVLERLSPLGFESFQLETLTLAEQADLFSSAGCIVSPHGAGLTNILFCRPAAVVVDIFAPTYINPCYWVMANELDLTYAYLVGEGARPPEGTDPEKRGDDIVVNVPALMDLLRLNGVE